MGRGTDKAAPTIATSVTETPSSVFADATCTDGVSGRGIGRGTGKAAPTIATSVTETPSSPTAACGAPMGPAPAVADVARLASIDAPIFSMRGEPKARNPATNQPARTTVPHNAANPASRRAFITPRFLSRPRPHPNRCGTPRHKTGCFSDQNQGIMENLT